MSANKYIPLPVIKRLPRYHRFLGMLKEKGVDRISSSELSRQMGLTASQIRQDLNCFGGFGQQGYGYNVVMLYDEIGSILGVNNIKKAILIGAGNLGQAIARHMTFSKWGFELIGIFDENPALQGKELRNNIIMPTADAPDFCEKNSPDLAILCVPNTEEVAEMIEKLVESGIKAFWNFTHIDIKAKHPEIYVENVHLSDSLVTLCYQLNSDIE